MNSPMWRDPMWRGELKARTFQRVIAQFNEQRLRKALESPDDEPDEYFLKVLIDEGVIVYRDGRIINDESNERWPEAGTYVRTPLGDDWYKFLVNAE